MSRQAHTHTHMRFNVPRVHYENDWAAPATRLYPIEESSLGVQHRRVQLEAASQQLQLLPKAVLHGNTCKHTIACVGAHSVSVKRTFLSPSLCPNSRANSQGQLCPSGLLSPGTVRKVAAQGIMSSIASILMWFEAHETFLGDAHLTLCPNPAQASRPLHKSSSSSSSTSPSCMAPFRGLSGVYGYLYRAIYIYICTHIYIYIYIYIYTGVLQASRTLKTEGYIGVFA